MTLIHLHSAVAGGEGFCFPAWPGWLWTSEPISRTSSKSSFLLDLLAPQDGQVIAKAIVIEAGLKIGVLPRQAKVLHNLAAH